MPLAQCIITDCNVKAMVMASFETNWTIWRVRKPVSLYLEADAVAEIADHFSCTNLLWLEAGGRAVAGRANMMASWDRESMTAQREGVLSTITPLSSSTALGLPSQLLGQLSNQVSRLFLRRLWSIVPSSCFVCSPQLC